jgi:hypothetical protein
MLSHSDLALALGMAGIVSVGWISWMLYLGLERQNCRVGA